MRAYAASLSRLNEGERAEFDVADGIDVTEAEAIALLFNPDLRVARMKARVPLAGARNAGLPDDPRFELDLLRILQSVSSPWVLGTGLQLTVPLSGRLAAERAQAFADASAAERAAHLAEWEHVVALRAAWTRWSATSERVRLVEQHLESVKQILASATALQEAGQIGVAQKRVLELEQVTRTGELNGLRNRYRSELLDLKARMGLTPYADVNLTPSFAPDPTFIERVAEEARLRNGNLELALARAEYYAADKALKHEARRAFPDLEIGPAFQSDEGIERLGAGIGIPVPIWNRNKRAIAEACATRAAAKAAYVAKYEELVGRLAISRAECEATAERNLWLREEVAPMADQQLTDLRRLGELGDMDILILKDALTTVLETKFQILDARLERALASNRRRALVEPLRTPHFPAGR